MIPCRFPLILQRRVPRPRPGWLLLNTYGKTEMKAAAAEGTPDVLETHRFGITASFFFLMLVQNIIY